VSSQFYTIRQAGRAAIRAALLFAALSWTAIVNAANVANAAGRWPQVDLPVDAVAYDIAPQLSVNGLPMQLRGFVSPRKPAEVARWFRQHLGQPVVENTLGGKLILGQGRGRYFLSVQLESLPNGTRGVVAVSDLKAAAERQGETRAATERLLSRLPPGSRLLEQTASSDGEKLARFAVVSNGYSEQVNRDRLVRMMREDGLDLEREAQAQKDGKGNTLFFKGAGKEAIAVISRGAGGSVTLALNTITFLEVLR
jgi:hypothetical protein